MVRLHLTEGRDAAISFRDLPLSDPEPSARVLGSDPATSVRRIRKRYLEAVASIYPAVSVYHNCWGVELVHYLDPARFRVGFLHSDFPCFPGMLMHFAPYFDAFININPGLHERSMEILSDWPQERFILLNSPVELPASLPRARGNKCIIGLVGRIKREQKRLDRLPAFLDALDRLLDQYEIHILGSGDFERTLRRRLKSRSNVRFLGWIEGAAYWDAIRQWRYLLFLSDYEGTPLSLIEGAHAGLRPVYPDFHPGAPLPAGLTRASLYPPGDIEAAARLVAESENADRPVPSPDGDLSRVHNPNTYLTRFHAMLSPERLAALPPFPASVGRVRKSFPDWGTLSLYNMHTKRLRFGWQGIIRHR